MAANLVSGTVWSPLGGVDKLEDWVLVAGELTSEGPVSMSRKGEGGGGSKTRCTICRGTPSNGNFGSNCGLKMVTAKGWLKNIYMRM